MSLVSRLALIAVATFAASAWAGNGHPDPIAPVILGVTMILFFAVTGRFIARHLGQPSVLGELLMGMVIGNLAHLFDLHFLEVLREGGAVFEVEQRSLQMMSLQEACIGVLGDHSGDHLYEILASPRGHEYIQVAHVVDVFSSYGVIFLLFLVGLGTSVEDLRRVGGESLRVAILGVIGPFILGFGAVRLLMPEASFNVDLFTAATLGATSIGITARVLRDLGQTRSHPAHVILGAAVFDDIIGLLMLAVVSGIVVSGQVQVASVLTIVVLSALYVGLAFWLGPHLLRFTIRLLRHLDVMEAKLFISFLFVMLMAWSANLVGLATIVGAFAAGLILRDAYFVHWDDDPSQCKNIHNLVAPIEAILVPIFFVLMGIQVKLESFFDWQVVTLAIGLLVAAIVGKLLSGLGAKPSSQRLAIGIGMLPRGEVGLIFAAIGKSLGVINDALFSAVVLMVIITTLITPFLLKRTLGHATELDQLEEWR